ncbi:MAG: 1-acyl-sn-glycerol-3-phosphate acyltransferase [Candidatus Eremiobacteraeota bacterium]|nr:1-acyl-sn-glycerol-3-phosphate acyltransferase [Candidatus Eremiobacteraeota bacterium]
MTLYEVAQKIVLPPILRLWRFKAEGRQNVPPAGPLIVACNHASYMDPVALGVACPRPISYMAKLELFAIPLLGPLIKRLNAYPVDRRQSALGGIKRSVEELRQGKAIGIFPQGTRVREGEGDAHEGVALLASLGKAPVVPARVIGSDQALHLHPIKVVFGRPLRLPEDRKANREDLANFTADIMRAIRELAPSS